MMEQKTGQASKPILLQRLNRWAKNLKTALLAIYLAAKHPETPLPAKIFSMVIVGYALSPIDFIPDFIPVLGYLDDIILLPLCIALVIRMLPPHVLAFCREEAQTMTIPAKTKFRAAAYVIIALWLIIVAVLYRCIIQLI